VASRAPQTAERAEEVVERARQLAECVSPVLSRVLATGGLTLGRLGLVLAFYLLGLFEAAAFRDTALRRLRPPAGEAVVRTAEDAAGRVRRYLVAPTKTCLISGAATALFALAVGLEAPLTRGLVAFLLNHVPTVGPFVSVVPPTLLLAVPLTVVLATVCERFERSRWVAALLTEE
jgi:predicted PurR-regulated permease PerM